MIDPSLISKTVGIPDGEYSEYEDTWDRCRDAVAGQREIKQERTEYLPMLEGQQNIPNSYEKYLSGALWYNASGRTKQAYKGLIFRKEPSITLPGSMSYFEEDATMTGIDLEKMIGNIVDEEITVSREAILVDYPTVDNPEMSQAEAEAQGIRPYFVLYKAEDILGYKTRRVENRIMITQVRLTECYHDDDDDEFSDNEKTQIRVLDLTDNPSGDGSKVYRQRIYRKKNDIEGEQDESDSKDNPWVEVPELEHYPKMNGSYIDDIPFFPVGGIGYREPFMGDLVDVNIHHYQTYADYSAGVKWTTRPQPYVTGQNPENIEGELFLGSGELWNFPDETAKVGMLEYTGQGLKAVEKKLDDLKQDMAILGARMLVPEKKQAETATAHLIKREGENSALSTVADLVSDCIEKALKFAAQWMNISPDNIEVALNKDYLPTDMPVQDMVQLWGLVQSGGITQQDYHWNLKQGERLDPALDDDERQSQLETQPPKSI